MATKKISALPAATDATDTDAIPAVQSGTTKKVTVLQIEKKAAQSASVVLAAQIFG